jgi:hypothetical protein
MQSDSSAPNGRQGWNSRTPIKSDTRKIWP